MVREYLSCRCGTDVETGVEVPHIADDQGGRGRVPLLFCPAAQPHAQRRLTRAGRGGGGTRRAQADVHLAQTVLVRARHSV